MKIPLVVGLVALSAVEMVVTILLAKYWGALLTFSLYAIPTTIGLFIHWRRRHVLKAASAKIDSAYKDKDKYEAAKLMSRPPFAAAQAELVTYWVSVILLLIPGPVTATVAFILMLPLVKRRFALSMQADFKKWLERMKALG